MMEERKIKIDGQWFYRGNLSPAWFAHAPRADGSMSGICEKVPAEVWPILEQAALAVELQAENERLREDAERYRWLKAHHLQTGSDSWIRTGYDLEEAIDAAREAKG